MVSERKKQIVKEVGAEVDKYSVVGIVDLYKLPARQLQEIRDSLRGKAIIKMVKKRLISLILRESKKKGIQDLEQYIQGMPALLFSNEDPFKLARIISKSKSSAPAKPGDIATKDIIINAGSTNLPPGPAIGDLQKIKLPVGVEGGKIVVKQDTVVARAGDEITKELADALAKLNINPMEIGLNLLAAYEDGVIYPKNTLFVPIEEYIEKIKTAYKHAFNLSLNINYITPATLPLLLAKAHKEAFNLALKANYVTTETLKPLLAKANKEAMALSSKVNLDTQSEQQPESQPEQPSKPEPEQKEPQSESQPQEQPSQEKSE
jgi:large subunit ribosomal protein L10